MLIQFLTGSILPIIREITQIAKKGKRCIILEPTLEFAMVNGKPDELNFNLKDH